MYPVNHHPLPRILAALCLAVMLGACGHTRDDRALSGAGIGAAAGAVGAAAAGGAAVTGAALGAAAGAVTGAVTDEDQIDLDDED